MAHELTRAESEYAGGRQKSAGSSVSVDDNGLAANHDTEQDSGVSEATGNDPLSAFSESDDSASVGIGWDPTSTQNECLACGASVSSDWARVFGDNENDVHACPSCSDLQTAKFFAAGHQGRDRFDSRRRSE